MEIRFPFEGVEVAYSRNVVKPSFPILSRPFLEIGEREFYLDVRNVAQYTSANGEEVHIIPYEGADVSSIQLFLTGSVFGSILHQRCLLPFHGSSFEYKGKGIVICGTAGAGKSSVTASFCQNGGRFINDDITPIKVSDSGMTIVPIKSRIKLWDDALLKLKIENENFEKIRPTLNKFYLPLQDTSTIEQQLNHVFILSIHNKDGFVVNELCGMAKHNALRNQIYRKMYLEGMPEAEKSYFKQLFQIAKTIRVTQITRPSICNINDVMDCIKKEIDR